MITTDRAMLLVAALVDAVRRHVDDRSVLDAIGREIERIAQPGSAGGARQKGRAETRPAACPATPRADEPSPATRFLVPSPVPQQDAGKV
jgi:hypothetical protein